ncbi:MAG TPA: glycosyltransferase family 4 protein [Stellaceae bacterium]|jgi:glycosyltransferase involved in cell wall biosynthesis|nr:glycosyltransferase family 4 protein [Stellaceae bacterium]
MSRGKVAILNHGYLPHYRVRFYELLAERSRFEYVVFHGAPPSWVGTPELKGPFAFPQRRVNNREFRAGPLTLVYQPVIREVMTGGYDAVVITTESKFIANLALVLLGKLRGFSVLYWGFGYHPRRGSRESDVPNPVMHRVTTAIKKGFTGLSDGFIAYTKSGAERLMESGYPRERTFFVQNTIDMSEQFRLWEAERDTDLQAIRREFGLKPDSTVFTFIGRLVPIKRVDQLIEAVRQINANKLSRRPVEAVIIGDGMCMDDLKAQAKDVPGIHFLGHKPPNDEVARCLKVSAASVVAGMVGLVANHALAHGCPVITRELDTHSPELEYIEHDCNGLIIPGDMDQFAGTLARLADDDAWQARLAQGALETRDGLRMDDMAARFDEAVRVTVDRRQSRGHLPMPQTEPGA